MEQEAFAETTTDAEELVGRRIRQRNKQIMIIFFVIAAGLLIYFFNPFSFETRSSFGSPREYMDQKYVTNRLIAFVFILSGVGLGLFVYLQSGSYKQIERMVFASLNESRESSPLNFSDNNDLGEPPGGTEPADKDSERGKTNREPPLGHILERKVAIIQYDYGNVINRLVDEIERLGRVANYNLVFGSVATVAGVIILTINAFDKPTSNSTSDILIHYIPRLSTVVFIEVFAFFFLRIYRANLVDIKYFHNERSNIEQKILSLKTALLTENGKYIKFVIKELAKTERNRVLKRGETTVELERERAEVISENKLLDLLKSVLDLKKGKK